METPTSFTCKIHGEFTQKPSIHIRTGGCQLCSQKIVSIKKSYTQDCFLEKANKIHGYKYEYSKVKYENSLKKIIITCKKHGEFSQSPAMHLQGQGCPSCVNSKGERIISYILKEGNIKFEIEKKFNNCKNIRPLPFDFYLPVLNLCIEFQGIQHFDSYHHMGGEKAFERLIKNDQIKKEFCLSNNIKLLEIRFDDNIEHKLKEYNII